MTVSRLEVIGGPMFSGKSEEMIKRVNRCRNAKKNYLVVKPRVDTRTESEIVSRAIGDQGTFQPKDKLPAEIVASRKELEALIRKINPRVIFFDEGQFFGKWIVRFIKDLLERGSLRIVVSGLDMDAWGDGFGPMPQLLAMANKVDKQTADCFRCGEEAEMTQKNASSSGKKVEVGDVGLYEARCRSCWTPPPKE